MEGEFNFLAFLPQKYRIELANYWYRDTSDEVKEFLISHGEQLIRDPNIRYHSDHPKDELFELIKQYLNPALSHKYSLAQHTQPELLAQLTPINQVTGKAANLMPEQSLLLVEHYLGEPKVFTIVRNSAHSNINGLLTEEDNRLIEEDYLTLVPGILGSYPGAMYRVSAFRLPQLVSELAALDDESDYQRFMDRYGVRRTDPRFWQHSDEIHTLFFKQQPLNAGILDLNRLENR